MWPTFFLHRGQIKSALAPNRRRESPVRYGLAVTDVRADTKAVTVEAKRGAVTGLLATLELIPRDVQLLIIDVVAADAD